MRSSKARIKIGVVIAAFILAGLWAGVKIARSATAIFTQYNWVYATSNIWTAAAPKDGEYSSKDANITVGSYADGNVKLSALSGSFTDTSQADFNNGNTGSGTTLVSSSGWVELARESSYTTETSVLATTNRPGRWTTVKAVDSGTYPVSYPYIFITNIDGQGDDAEFAKSTDGGKTFTTLTIDPNSVSDQGMSLSVLDTSKLFITYKGGRMSFRKSTNGGSSWTNELTIHNASGAGYHSAVYAKDANNIIAFWRKSNDLWQTKTSLGGDTAGEWSTPAIIASQNMAGYFTKVTGVGNSVWVAYREERSYGGKLIVLKSNNFGNSWAFQDHYDSRYIAQEGGVGIYALDANNVYLAYYLGAYSGKENKNLWFKKSSTGGDTLGEWTAAVKVDGPNAAVGRWCDIYAADTSNIFISYYDETNLDLKLAKSTNGGSTWSNTTLYSVNDVGRYTSIDGMDKNTIFISFERADSADDLYFARYYKRFKASGNYYSKTFDTQSYLTGGTISWTMSKPSSTTAILYARGSDSSTPVTTTSGWTQVTPGASGNLNGIISGYRYIQYRLYMTTNFSNRIVSPIVKDVSISYTGYPRSDGVSAGSGDNKQEITSLWFNSGLANNGISQLNWTETVASPTTDVRFQLRTAADAGGSPSNPTSWLGPTGTSDWYTDPAGGETINAVHRDGVNDQWFQYKAWLYNQGSATPTLQDISIETFIPPDAPQIPDLASADDTGYSSSDNITTQTTGLTFSGTCDANTTVKLYDAGSLIGTDSTTPDGSWSIDVNLAEGTHPITSRATDNGGNESVASAVNTVIVDTTAPQVSNVSASTANGVYKAGDSIDLTVQFNENVSVSAPNLTLALETGTIDRNAAYQSVSGDTITLRYTVADGDSASDLDYKTVNSLVLNSGIIQDAAGNNAVLTLASPGAANSLGANKAIAVDTTRPAITDISSQTAEGYYKAGDEVLLAVTFSEPVTVSGSPYLSLGAIGTAGYLSGSGTANLTFKYVIPSGVDSENIGFESTNDFYSNDSTIRDSAGNDAVLTLPGAQTFNIAIDNTQPRILNVQCLTPPGAYNAGKVITLKVTFSEPVTLGQGTPVMGLAGIGNQAEYFSGSGTAEWIFKYTIQDGQNADKLNYSGTDAFVTTGVSMGDRAGNGPSLTLSAPPSTGLLGLGGSSASDVIKIDTIKPSVVGVTIGQGSGVYGIGDEIPITIEFSEPVTVPSGESPYLELETGTTDRNAVYTSGSGTKFLTFTYTVQEGDTAANLRYKATDSLKF